MVVSCRTINDQDLLSGRVDVVFEPKVLFGSPEQIVHCRWWFFCERFEKRHTRKYVSLKDLQDRVYATRLHLEHNLSKPFHEVS